MKKKKILPSITTITPSVWRGKIEEAKVLGLKEVALFPTCLELAERKELYELLEKSGIEKIPFVHLRSDMELWELDYLIERWRTKVFNTHTEREYSIPLEWKKYKKIIYIENVYYVFDEEEIKEFAGICIDFSHLENNRLLRPEIYLQNMSIIKKYPVGCAHIGAIRPVSFVEDEKVSLQYDSHFLKELSELDYLRRYPQKYFSSFLALEMENDLTTQLKARDYIINMLK